MFTYMFKSRFLIHIDESKYINLKLTEDPSYLDKKGNRRYMINAKTKEELEHSKKEISKLISEYCLSINPRRPNSKAPPPLTGLIL